MGGNADVDVVWDNGTQSRPLIDPIPCSGKQRFFGVDI